MVDFLIIGNGGGALGMNDICELFIQKEMWFGMSITSGYRYFEVPDDYEFYGTVCKEEEGKRYIAVSGVRWFTNLDCERHPFLELKKYDPDKYEFYDGTNVINIDRTEDIPDYDGVMGVPVTFIDKWNQDQFEVIGYMMNGGGRYDKYRPIIDGNWKYRRLLIKRKR